MTKLLQYCTYVKLVSIFFYSSRIVIFRGKKVDKKLKFKPIIAIEFTLGTKAYTFYKV